MNSRATNNGIGFRTDKNDSVAAIASPCIMPRPIIFINKNRIMELTPKEEAKKIVDKFLEFTQEEHTGLNYNSKQCALLCVDWHLKEFTETYGDDLIDNIEYWENIKVEINKL